MICLQDVIPKSHLSSFKLSENEMEVIKPEELEESDALLDNKDARKNSHRQRLGLLVRAIDSRRREQKKKLELLWISLCKCLTFDGNDHSGHICSMTYEEPAKWYWCLHAKTILFCGISSFLWI